MTVEELSNVLSGYPQDFEVKLAQKPFGYDVIDGIEVVKQGEEAWVAIF